MTRSISDDYTKAFDALVQEGIAAYDARYGIKPTPSHICFKFTDAAAYQKYVAQAASVGQVMPRSFKGHEISWCKLHSPLQAGRLSLEWLELVAPDKEGGPFTGVTAIGYCLPELEDVVKIPSSDANVVFRYQRLSAADIVR